MIAGEKEQVWCITVPYMTKPVKIRMSSQAIHIDDYRLPLGERILDCSIKDRWMMVHSCSCSMTDDDGNGTRYTELVDVRSKEVRILNHKAECKVDLLNQTVTWPGQNICYTFKDISEMAYDQYP